eukprot:TRINITY_DN3778_c0_g1_i16.p2 TRINITY_DN3778_c0_g1~~TRINITY_DN3778_c0_g1_i16.p2  ORF type:complete len:408 (+),score=79.57 TRINITY_DN3778_c0_g1_i16:192-1415(+)
MEKKPNAALSDKGFSSEDEKDVPNPFGKKKKSVTDNAHCFYRASSKYYSNPDNSKIFKRFEKYSNRIKSILQKVNNKEEHDVDLVVLVTNNYFNKAMMLLIMQAHLLPFEIKKDIIALAHDAMKVSTTEDAHPCVDYFVPFAEQIVNSLFNQYGREDMGVFAGNILRIFLKYSPLLKIILTIDNLKKLVDHINTNTFENSSEAFATLHSIFPHRREKERKEVAKFIAQNYDKFFEVFNQLLKHDNYLSMRTSLKMLFEILNDPTGEEIRDKYINNADNLISIMNLLVNNNKRIQNEAARLFELFIMNLGKVSEERVLKILKKNKLQLLQHVREMTFDEEADNPINQELLIHEIEKINEFQQQTLLIIVLFSTFEVYIPTCIIRFCLHTVIIKSFFTQCTDEIEHLLT